MVLHGSAYLTKDADFCYARTCQNLKRLEAALKPYHPRLRGADADLPFVFDARAISRGMNFTLATDLGPLDFLGGISGLGAYEAVKAAAETQMLQGDTAT